MINLWINTIIGEDYLKFVFYFYLLNIRSTSSKEIHLTMPNLTISDNGSLFTCRAVQADMGRSVPTTVKLIVEGGDKTQGNHYLNFRLISESEKQTSKFVDALHSNTIKTASISDISDNHVIENIEYLKSSTNKNTFSISLIDITIIVMCVCVYN